ncbi:MAG: hypothetical protein WCI79_01560 [Candidatus Saccharibacteria bacterium]
MKNSQQSGSVSLFMVVFATLLITIVTVGFVKIMLQGQQQASATDLSQSAYDSAQAGVEDSKRAILRYKSLCDLAISDVDCGIEYAKLNSPTCNLAVSMLDGRNLGDSEIAVQTGNKSLDQAYTCTKISMETPNYMGNLAVDGSKMIPLIGSRPFKAVQIDWFSAKNLQNPSDSAEIPAFSANPQLPDVWDINKPSIIRAQVIQFNKSGFSVSDFDSNSSNALFLYPSNDTSGAAKRASIALDIRPSPENGHSSEKTIKQVHCTGNLLNDLYACSVVIDLPVEISADRAAYLNLASIYNSSDYSVKLLDSAGGAVGFKSVQPEIDSTGRANNLFRRVVSRIELTDVDFPYPQAAVDVEYDFCKTFTITNVAAGYSQGDCSPDTRTGVTDITNP